MPSITSPAPKMPAGYRLVRLESCDSTNAEARRRADAGEPGPLWIWSMRQSAGRGRNGRTWQSQPGNLFASLLLGLQCPLSTASQLALVAGIAAYETVASFLPYEEHSDLVLKWPNDVLFGEEKVAGVLLESVSATRGAGCKVVVGTGINIASHPKDLPQPATSLSAHGAGVTVGAALEALAVNTHSWISRWEQGSSFTRVRRAWLDRAGPTGRPIKVRIRDGEEAEGTFAGLDSAGSLRLVTSDGTERRIAAGDVFFARS
jgi:BirA family biotin operon repressor/biotin-[acetyl-CoA-carboxylase] ligase